MPVDQKNIKAKIKHLLQGLLNPNIQWSALAPYIQGDGIFQHTLFPDDSLKALFDSIRTTLFPSFPDVRYHIHAISVTDNGQYAHAWTTVSGTFNSVYLGKQPNGKKFRTPSVWQFALQDGKVRIAQEVVDHLAVNKQLGVTLFTSHKRTSPSDITPSSSSFFSRL